MVLENLEFSKYLKFLEYLELSRNLRGGTVVSFNQEIEEHLIQALLDEPFDFDIKGGTSSSCNLAPLSMG